MPGFPCLGYLDVLWAANSQENYTIHKTEQQGHTNNKREEVVIFNGQTHKAFGLLAGYGFHLVSFADPITSIGNIIVIYVSSTMPDWDLKLGLRHRGFTHSLICMGGITYLVFAMYPAAVIPFLVGYGSHLLSDSFTVTGIEALWPWHKKLGAKLISTGKKRHRVVR